jgi:hypothetical protein
MNGGRGLDASHVLSEVKKETEMLELGSTTTATAVTM